MPVYEEPKGWGWVHYVALGCGGCLVLVLIVFVGGSLFVGHMVSKTFSSGMAPPKRTGPYHWGNWSSAASVSIPLPNGHGTLTYGHELIDPSLHYGGGRGLRLVGPKGTTQEWPLQYSDQTAVRVGVYWHPAKNGQGPFVRFQDATGESVLDLGRREVGSVGRAAGKAYMSDYAYDDTSFSPGGGTTETDASGKTTTTFESADGTPATDVTSALSPGNCTYLGSIIRSGNKLIFKAAPSGGKAGH